MSFAPKTLIPVSVGRTTVNLYPVVNTTMLVHERAHAFQINKTALSSQALELSIIQALDGSHQRGTLQLMLKATQQAEDNFTSTQRIARDAIGLTQAFPAIAHATGSNQAMALPSQAKMTLSGYFPRGGRQLSLQPAKAQGQQGCWPAMAVGGRIHGWNTNRATMSLFALIKTIKESKRMWLELWNG
jgi:hypothetical protein